MKLFHLFYLLISLSLTAASTRVPKYAKESCNDMCGSVRIPFPFGIGAKCAINDWYIIDCNSSIPYLAALNNLQVLRVDLENQTVIVNMPTISKCSNSSLSASMDLGNNPFLFSKTQNNFVFEGCGNAFILDHDHGTVLTGCSASCHNDTTSTTVNETINKCIGIGCCQMIVPRYFKSYTTRLETHGGCGSAFLVDKNYSYDGQGRFYDQFVVGDKKSLIPMSLLWTLSETDYGLLNCCYFDGDIVKVDLGNGSVVDTVKCQMPYYERNTYFIYGNPYLRDGCFYSTDPESTDDQYCARCRNTGGHCDYFYTYDVDGLVYGRNHTCHHYDWDYYNERRRSSLGIILGVSIVSEMIFMGIIYGLYKLVKKTITRRRRKRIFKRINCGLLLKQQEEVDPSLVDKTILFTSRELKKATDGFNENRILGRGGQGTIYKGMLVDGRIVAVKKSMIVDESQLEQFINEVVILSQVNHRNVVKLLGCCLETEVPLLVSEFISNGTLYDLIHNETDEFSFSWNLRLQIATEVAGALAYLHSSTSIPIYHRDIKTTNILLDDKYKAKVSDFGTSKFVSMDQTHLTTLVKGTFGYLDPEYFQSSQLTEKSDVYSFGVVLVELLTGERPISLTRFGENRSLASHFILAIEEERVLSIFDEIVIREGARDELHAVANLAMRCLNPIGKNRPAIKEVAVELETIRISHVNSIVKANIVPVMYREQLSMLACGETSPFSCDGNISE